MIASGADMRSNKSQRHTGSHISGPRTDAIDAYVIHAIQPTKTAMEKPIKLRTTGPRKLLVKIVRSYIFRTAAHASSPAWTPYGASPAAAAAGTPAMRVPENKDASTPSARSTVGVTSVFVTMPARRVVLELRSFGEALSGSPPIVAIIIGASKKPLRSAAAGGDGVTSSNS